MKIYQQIKNIAMKFFFHYEFQIGFIKRKNSQVEKPFGELALKQIIFIFIFIVDVF